MFIIGFILANRCSVKRLKVKVKKMTRENLSITKNAMKAASYIQGFYLQRFVLVIAGKSRLVVYLHQCECLVVDRES